MTHARLRTVALACAAGALAAAGPPAAGAGKTLVVEAGDKDRAGVLLSAEMPAEAKSATMTDAAGKEVACQVTDGKLWWVLDKLAAGKSGTYTVAVGGTPSAAAGVAVAKAKTKLDVTIDGKPFTSYNLGPKLHWGGDIWRPCFFPLFGPDGVQMLRPWPLVKDPPKTASRDHSHHTGVWVAHGRVNGVDNWSARKNSGHIVHKSFDVAAGGPVVGLIREQLDWTDRDGKPNLAETRTMRIWRMPDGTRVLDIESNVQAKYGKVVFGDTKEGGMCATRMRDEMRADKGGHLVNSEGQSARGAWGKRAKFVCCYGKLDGKDVGYAIFDAPSNLRHPTYWHARTYGLVTANPFGIRHFDRKSKKSGDWTLEADTSRLFRYRVVFYSGTPQTAKVADRYADYADPPKVAWK